MDSELSNEAGNEFKILEPLLKDAKLILQKWVLKQEAMAIVHIRLRQRSKFHLYGTLRPKVVPFLGFRHMKGWRFH